MKNLIVLFISTSLFILPGCTSIKKDAFIKDKRLACGNVRLAILPFKDTPGQPGSGRKVADTLTTALIRIKNWSLVERSRLEAIIKEKELNATGLTTADYSNIARITHADFLILGSVSEFYHGKKAWIVEQTKLSYRARIIDARSADVVGTVNLDMETGKNAWLGCLCLSWYYIPVALFTEQNISKDMSRSSRRIVDVIEDRIEDYRDDHPCK